MDAQAHVGVVVIGRNEGARLARCLASLAGFRGPVVYVDSCSSDNSTQIARAMGCEVVELENRPLSAARARNAGFEHLPGVRYVQFVDGDCTLHPGWIEAAAAALDREPRRAAVLGHVEERDAGASAYSRLCALEWRSAPGELADYGCFGGISMIRAAVFRALGGFRAGMIAGEDSELGVRMALAGHRVAKLDYPMATHEAAIASFAQWWRRAVRAGHAIGERAALHGDSALRDCVRERASTLFWGLALPLGMLAAALPTQGATLLLAAAYPLLALRIWRRRQRAGDGARDAALYAVFVVLGKFANAAGLARFLLGRHALIEYK